MDKRVLKNIILEQHNIIRKMQINQRDYELEDNMCYVLVGMRRVRKSYTYWIKKLDNEAIFLVARPHFYAKNAL